MMSWLGKKKGQSGIISPVKIFFKNEGEIKIIYEEGKLRDLLLTEAHCKKW